MVSICGTASRKIRAWPLGAGVAGVDALDPLERLRRVVDMVRKGGLGLLVDIERRGGSVCVPWSMAPSEEDESRRPRKRDRTFLREVDEASFVKLGIIACGCGSGLVLDGIEHRVW